MPRTSGQAARVWAMLTAFALLVPFIGVLGVVGAPPAAAAEVIGLAKEGPSQILVGDSATYTLTATNPTGGPDQVPQYNLSFRDVLPPGVVYVGPTSPASAGAPTIVTNRLVPSDPASEYQTLIWSNVADLQIGSSAELSFTVRAARDPWPVASTFSNVANAYTNSDPRYVPDFDANGVVISGETSYTASATATTVNTGVTAFRIDKTSAPNPEGELLRGIHDHVATYTLRVTNNPSYDTDDIQVRDYIPAGLEFLGCGTVDNSTDTALYPEGLEYEDAPPLTATPVVPACNVPTSVETVTIGDGFTDQGRVIPPGVYTKVTWEVGDFDPSQAKEIVYRAGIPQRANTTDWQGTDAPDALGGGTIGTQPPQTANLDNNTGPPTRETDQEQALTNIAVGDGLYTGPVPSLPGPGPFPVGSSTSHTVTAEDLDLHKSVSPTTFDSTGAALATYTLIVETSEYVTSSGIVITDVLPDGVCPVWGNQTPTVTGEVPPECGTGGTPQGANLTNATLSSVTRNANGTWSLVFAPFEEDTNEVLTITYQGRMRDEYSSNGQPTSAGDSFTNNVSLTGTTNVRDDVNAPEPDGPLLVEDQSSATQTSTQPTIDKRIKPNVSGALGYRCDAGTGTFVPGAPVSAAGAAEYVDPATADPALTPEEVTFRNGSVVCFLLRVQFPAQSRTKNPVVTDFLPAGTTYVEGSAVLTARSTLTGDDVLFAPVGGVPGWRVGEQVGTNRFAPEGAVFEVVLAASIDGAAPGTTPDIVGNLMKFRSENTAGQAISLRDQLDFQIAPLPPVSLVKGIAAIDPAVGANVDVNVPSAVPNNTDGLTVRDGDVVTFRIDTTNASTNLGAFASSVRTLDVWDLLPPGVPCANVTNPSNAAFFTCTEPVGPTGRGLLRWQFDNSDDESIDVGDTKTLTYDFLVPANISVATVLTDNAGVRSYQAFTNLPGEAATYYPANNIDPSVPPAQQTAPRADDPSHVVVANVTLAKTGTTTIDEVNNNTPNQATIGETVTYTVDARVPYGASVYQGVLTDTLPAGLTFVSATASFSGNGGGTFTTTLPTGTTGPNSSGQLVTLGLPPSYTDAATVAEDHVFRMTIVARVSTDASNTHGTPRTNTASFLSNASIGGLPVSAPESKSYDITVVEPDPTLAKSASPSVDVVAGQVVTYTLTATNAAGRPPLHNTWVVDCVPSGLQFLAYGTPTDGTTQPPVDGTGTNGCQQDETKLVWQPNSAGATPAGTLLASAPATLTYTARVSTTSAGLTPYTNVANLNGGTLHDASQTSPESPANPLERTYPESATATITVQGGTVAKSVNPTSATIGQTVTWTITETLPARVNFYQAAVIDQVEPGIDLGTLQTISVDCEPDCSVPGTPLTPAPAPAPSTGTLIGWNLGDIPQIADVRTVTITYSARVANLSDPVRPVRGDSLLDTATLRWDSVDRDGSPGSAGDTWERTSAPATATVTVLEPFVTIEKGVDNPTPAPGVPFNYNLAIRNPSGTNASTAFNVRVQDVVPVGVVVQAGSISNGGTIADADPDTGGGTITWPVIAAIPPGGLVSRSYTALLAPSANLTAAAKVNVASVTGYNSMADGSGRQYVGPSDDATVTPQFPLVTPDKTLPNGSVAYVGTPFTWRIALRNDGASRAFGVDAVDTLPPNWTFTSVTSITVAGSTVPIVNPDVTGAGTVISPQVLTWTDLGAINPGQTIVITFRATPQQGALTNPGTGPNAAHTNRIDTTAEDRTGAQGSADGPYNGPFDTAIARIHRTDLVLTKGHVGTPVAGSQFTWTINVRNNNGPNIAVGPFVVTDTIQAPMTYAGYSGTGWTCSATGALVTCTHSAANLAVNAALPELQLRVAIPSDTALPLTLQNSATVTGRTYESNTANNTGTDSVGLTAVADLAIVKQVTTDPIVAGRPVTYTLDVTNKGPSTSRATITVEDAVPDDTTFISASGDGWECPADNALIGTIVCTRDTDLLANTSAGRITVTLLVASDYPVDAETLIGSLTNSATVTGVTPEPNPDDGDNTSTVTRPVTTQASLTIEKAHTGDFVPGTNTNEYTFDVLNNGPSDAAAPVTVTDQLPEYLSWTGTSTDTSDPGRTWECTASPASTPTPPERQTVTCVLTGALAADDSVGLRIGIAVAANAPTAPDGTGSFLNEVLVTSPTDPDGDTDDDETQFDTFADLAIAKTPVTQTAIAGGPNVTWQLQVTNNGPSDSRSPTTVTDILPLGTTFVSAAGDGWQTCQYASTTRTITCVYPGGVPAPAAEDEDAPPGALPPITIVVSVPASVRPTTLTNVTEVDGPTNEPEGALGNNHDEAELEVEALADLGILKTFTAGETPVDAGSVTTFTLAVHNYGPSDADDLIVSDVLPAGLTFVSAAGTGWTCPADGASITTIVCTRASLAAEADAPAITVTVKVDPGFTPGTAEVPSTIENTATVDAATDEPEFENPEDEEGPDSSTDSIDIVAHADLTLDKSHDEDVTPVAGEEFTFSLLVTNEGPSNAQAPVVIRDQLPPGLSYVSNGLGWECTTSGTPAVDQVVECTLDGDGDGDGDTTGFLGANTSAPVLTLTTFIAANVDAGELENSAIVSSPTPDQEPDNNDDTDVIIVFPLADLVVTKSHTGPVAIGTNLAFTLGVTNLGPSEARAVTMVDTLPEGLTYVSATGEDWACGAEGQVVTCKREAPLAPRVAAPPITLTVAVGPKAYPKVDNVVVGSTSTTEDAKDNNRATDPVTVPPLVDLAIDKTHVGSFTVGQQGTYTLTVTNNGPTADPGPQTIVDTLPTGLTFVSASGDGWTCSAAAATVTCTRPAALAVAATSTLSAVVLVGPAAAPSVVNTATVSTPSTETTTTNNTDSDLTAVIPVSVLTIDKEAVDVDGDVVTYLITVGNTGPNATSTPIVISDPLPAGLAFESVGGASWTCTEGQTVTCTYVASLPVGGTASFELVARLTADPGEEVTNVASVIGEDGALVSDSAVVEGPPAPDDGDDDTGGLADTGAELARLLAVALLLLVFGAAAVRRGYLRT